MKINKTISALAVAMGLVTGSQAANTVFITGSTAFRAQVFQALTDLGLSVQGGATGGNNIFTFTGTVAAHLPSPSNTVVIATSGDTGVTVFCSFTGSSEAVNSLGNHVSPTYTNYSGTPTGFTYANGGDLGFCDVQEASTVFPTPAVNEITSGDSQNSNSGTPGVAIVPFTWATSVDGAGKIVNVTPYIVNDIYANGSEELAFFTGNASDASTTVRPTGRTNDSGTRITGLLDVGYNTLNTVVQYALGTAGVCPGVGKNSGTVAGTWQKINDDGYTSGGSVAKALSAKSTGNAAISYLGWPDANGLTNGALPINYEGVSPSSVSNVTALTWNSGGSPTPTPWNIAGVANGSYTFWSYEHLFESTLVASGSFADQFGNDLANALEYEILHPPTGQVQTALTIGEMNVNRSGGDGTDVNSGGN